jgi:hypothetical protein
MKANKHSKPIDKADIQAAITGIDQILKLFEDNFTPLTPRERHDLLKMGDNTLEFVEKCYLFADANPSLRPPFINMDDFKTEFNNAHGMFPVVSKVVQLLEGLTDIQKCAVNAAYLIALMSFKAGKNAAANNVPGAQALYEDLSESNPRKGRPSHADSEAAEHTQQTSNKEQRAMSNKRGVLPRVPPSPL